MKEQNKRSKRRIFNGKHLLGSVVAVASDGFFVFDALMDSIALDAIVNECSADVMAYLTSDDGVPYFAYALHTFPLDHFHAPCLQTCQID